MISLPRKKWTVVARLEGPGKWTYENTIDVRTLHQERENGKIITMIRKLADGVYELVATPTMREGGR